VSVVRSRSVGQMLGWVHGAIKLRYSLLQLGCNSVLMQLGCDKFNLKAVNRDALPCKPGAS
jgi:hypothetical protein